MTATADTLARIDRIRTALQARTFRYRTETDLQQALRTVFVEVGLDATPEVMIAKGDRIDFLIGDVGVEVKTRASFAEVARQLHRYAQSDKVAALVLVTASLQHRGMTTTMNDKPVRVVYVGGAF